MTTRSGTGKIVYLFSLLAMIFVVLCSLSIQQLSTSNEKRAYDEEIQKLNSNSLEIFKVDVDFFGYELNNPELFKSGNSIYLSRHDSLVSQFRSLHSDAAHLGDIDKRILSVFNSYDSAFRVIVNLIKIKGYKGYGLEGKMRGLEKVLEDKKLISELELLRLRDVEQDYLLSSGDDDRARFDDMINQLLVHYKSGAAVEALTEFSTAFHELSKASDTIGLETQKNLKGNLNKLTNQLGTLINNLDKSTDQETIKSYKQGLTFFLVAVIGGAILCLALIILIASKIKE